MPKLPETTQFLPSGNYSTIMCVLYVFSLGIYDELTKKQGGKVMKIAVICANGKEGKLIVKEATR